MTAAVAMAITVLIALSSIRASLITVRTLRDAAIGKTQVERKLIWLHFKRIAFVGLVAVTGLLVGVWWELG